MSAVPDAALLAARVQALIAARQPGAHDIVVTNVQPLSGGNARRAWALDAAWTDAAGRHDLGCVLLGRVEAGQLEVVPRREFDTLAALDGHGLAVPRALWLDADGALLGMPGFVMARGEGRTDVVALLAPGHPHSRSLALQLVELAARVHALDWRSLTPRPQPASDPARAIADQLDHWHEQFLRQRMEPVPALASVFGWLRRHIPSADAQGALAVVHGDLRFGNFLHDEGRLTLLLDWELAHLGDPLEDLAWMYRSLWSPRRHLPFDEAVAAYEAARGVGVDRGRLAWWRIFSEAKFAVISLTAARSFIEGRTQNLRMAGRAAKVNECVRQSLLWIGEIEEAHAC